MNTTLSLKSRIAEETESIAKDWHDDCSPYTCSALGFNCAIYIKEPMTQNMLTRVMATDGALSLLASLSERHGPLLLFQAGGSGDGNSLLCYAFGDDRFTNTEVYLGNVNGTPLYVEHKYFEYWKRTQLVIDAAKGTGATNSLESGLGMRFLTRTRLLTDEESQLLVETEFANPHHAVGQG